ncbi:DUF456 domain-containing protein [Arenimonas oryziterrae]|uniref:DUF456 domain-containing protein n=1 Tax=Arenimonas oryziterrae DSM 21050 = YC6267 TaxID=1121015 RepID=A0A091AU48_9GAMM|nr:DUF456 domain-containing protein [Arenimonas oryziterrae]KFN42876.1 hypothetical protein N789_12160 [Arenimonas oryziterrae DSM 21050 = YC6267]
MDNQLVLYLLSALLIVVGLAGTVLPALPGLPLMFVGMLLAAWAGDFRQIGAGALVLLAVIMLLALAADILTSLYGAKRAGASKHAMWGAAIGTLAGFFFGLPGLVLGPFVGAIAGEKTQGSDWRKASRIGLATWMGLAVGTVIKIGLAVLMLAVFAIAWFWN